MTLLVLFATKQNFAQTYQTKHFGVNQGLPSSECYWLLKDSKGYLWIATDAGVVKYDGYKFTTYNNSKGLPDNTVFKIHEDNHGKIWFSTFSGEMAYYDHETDTIKGILCNHELKKILKKFPIDFTFDINDTLHISSTYDGILKIAPPYYKNISLENKRNNGYYIKTIDTKNFIYGSVIDQTNERRKIPINLEGNQGSKKTQKQFTTESIISFHSVIKYNSDYLFGNGKFIFFISNNLKYKLASKANDLKKEIISIYKDSENRIWLNTRGDGTLIYTDTSLSKAPIHLLDKMCVTSVIEDKNKGYWLATLEDGVFFIPSLEYIFFNESNGLTADKIHSIVLVDSSMYCLTANYKIIKIGSSNNTIEYFTNTFPNASFIYKHANKIYVCSSESDVINIDNKKKYPLWIKNSLGKKSIVRIKRIVPFNDNYLLGYFDGSIVKINTITNECTLLLGVLPRITSLKSTNNTILIGTIEGLYSYSNAHLKYLGDEIPLLKCRIEDICTVNNSILLATKGLGIICLENGKIKKRITEENGLQSNICRSITIDKYNAIWVGTNKGISRILLKGNSFSINNITVSDGLPSNEINQLITSQNKLYFATNKGAGFVMIDKAIRPLLSIPVYIENIFANDIKRNHLQPSILKHDENFIKISHKGIDIKSEGNIVYKLKLVGLDTNWTSTKNTNIQYTTLPAGTYTFMVSVVNTNNQLLNTPATVSFTIEKPFWLTWWFIIASLSLTVSSIYLIYNRRIKIIELREIEKTEVNRKVFQSELKALRAQMNPHFMFNAINSIQSFVIKNDSKSAQKYLTKFARLIRSVLENSKYDVIPLSKEIDALNLYMELEALRASFCFDFDLTIEASLNTDSYYIPPMIIQPYIENAILHGLTPLTERKGNLQVKFTKLELGILCTIEDNGIGRNKAEEIKTKKAISHKSMGMEVTADRIDLLNKQSNKLITKVEIFDMYSNGVPNGTKVEISINSKIN